MKRGEVWTVAGGGAYAGKPRPVVIVQEDSFDATDSITICAFTTDQTDAPFFRLPLEPNERNGLRSPSRLMVDKITTVSKSKLGERIGRLDNEDLVRLNQAMMVFLGLATLPTAGRKDDDPVDMKKFSEGPPPGMLDDGKLNVVSPDNPELKRRLAATAKEGAKDDDRENKA